MSDRTVTRKSKTLALAEIGVEGFLLEFAEAGTIVSFLVDVAVPK